MISMTSTVMIAIVIIRFVAILLYKLAISQEPYRHLHGKRYLRAIPLNVFTLLSTYPSLSSIVALVCCIVSLCICKSANVPCPIASVSFAIRWLSLNLWLLLSSLSVPLSSCCRCSCCASRACGSSLYREPSNADLSVDTFFSFLFRLSTSDSWFRKRGFMEARDEVGIFCFSRRSWSNC